MSKHAESAPDKTQTAPQDEADEASAKQDEEPRNWINHPKSVARLQILVVVMGVLIAVGFATVIGRIAYLALRQPDNRSATQSAAAPSSPRVFVPAANPTEELPIEIPQGAVVEDIQPMSDGSLMVHLTGPRGTGLLLVDPSTGAVLKTLRFVPAGN